MSVCNFCHMEIRAGDVHSPERQVCLLKGETVPYAQQDQLIREAVAAERARIRQQIEQLPREMHVINEAPEGLKKVEYVRVTALQQILKEPL